MWKRRGDEEKLEDKEAEEELEKCVARWERLCLAEEGKTDRGWLECCECVCVCLDETAHPLPTSSLA